MKHKKLFVLLAILVLVSMVMAACAPAAEEPVEEPVVEEPVEEPMAFEGKKVEAPNCDYGGKISSIEAVDEFTVKFTMCKPFPHFPAIAAFTSRWNRSFLH
jgi:ABC-type oligopeptide transport system substrate-binding subunit